MYVNRKLHQKLVIKLLSQWLAHYITFPQFYVQTLCYKAYLNVN